MVKGLCTLPMKFIFVFSMTPLALHFEDDAWICWLSYLTHIFSKLGDLTLNLTYFQWKMKCVGFIATVSISRTVKTENLTVFPTLMDLLDENDNKKHPAGS